MLPKICVLFLGVVAATSGFPQGVKQEQAFYITARDGSVLTAFPEQPADFPGHSYPIPGKVLAEVETGRPEQQWTISEFTPGYKSLLSLVNSYNEVDTWMIDSMSFPMTLSWDFAPVGDGSDSIYITSRSFPGRCLNNDGLNSRIHISICDSAGSGSKWTLTPVRH